MRKLKVIGAELEAKLASELNHLEQGANLSGEFQHYNQEEHAEELFCTQLIQ